MDGDLQKTDFWELEMEKSDSPEMEVFLEAEANTEFSNS
jgi:hypothetical protein